jgi:hypothetical protein
LYIESDPDVIKSPDTVLLKGIFFTELAPKIPNNGHYFKAAGIIDNYVKKIITIKGIQNYSTVGIC